MRFEPGTYTIREMLIPVFRKGECVYESPSLMEIQKYCRRELSTLRPESQRLINAQTVHVDLSRPLYDLKQKMLQQYHLEK